MEYQERFQQIKDHLKDITSEELNKNLEKAGINQLQSSEKDGYKLMNAFCNNCEFVKNSTNQRGKHFCEKYNKQLKHLRKYGNIVKAKECINEEQ